MKTFYTILAPLIAIGISVLALVHAGAMTTNFGATANAGANALFEQSLAQPLGTTDTNMYVTSGADIQGNLLPLNSYQCLSLDTGQPNFEAICGNVTASATSGLTLAVTIRGLSTQTATTSNPSFIFTHRRGADVRITDFPALTVVNNQLSGTQVIPNAIYYSSNFTPSFWTTAPSSTLATLGIVNSTAAAGCGNANETASGCSQLATSIQAALGTSLGSTNARLVIGNNLATSTPYNGGTNVIPVTGTNEKLSQLFLDLTQAFNVTGLWNFSATTTMATSTVASSTVSNTLNVNNLNVIGTATGLGWNLLLSTTTTATMSIATTTFPGTPQDLMVVLYNPNVMSNNGFRMFFNGDTSGSNNYGYSLNSFGGGTTPTSGTSINFINLLTSATTSPSYITINIKNLATSPKPIIWTADTFSGGAVAPSITNGAGQWANTSNTINSIEFWNGGGTFAAGMKIQIYGSGN